MLSSVDVEHDNDAVKQKRSPRSAAETAARACLFFLLAPPGLPFQTAYRADNGEGLNDAGEAGANGTAHVALPPGMRQMLNIPAPLPQPQSNQVRIEVHMRCRIGQR